MVAQKSLPDRIKEERTTLNEILRRRVSEWPDKQLFRFLEDGEGEGSELTYQQLDDRSRAIASKIRAETEPGDRILLLYDSGLEYITAFFGCIYAGRIAVPVYPPNPNKLQRTLPRLMHIVRDAEPAAVATTSTIKGLAGGLLENEDLGAGGISWCVTDELEVPSDEPPPEEVDEQTVVFLQYTSGSTRRPRGVRITHENLLHNVALISESLGVDSESVGVSWLPMYHDMGLIGKIITPVVTGCSVILMAPRDFLRKPERWLRAISEYGGTISAAPNFAYELCVRKVSAEEVEALDLSTWRVALNGAEPVRAETVDAFSETFEPAGFRQNAFFPAYGLAESTLLVTGSPSGPRSYRVTEQSLEQGKVEVIDDGAGEPGKRLVSSGDVPEGTQEFLIVDPEGRRRVEEGRVGEIWVSSPSVADGYWRRPDESAERFEAELAGEEGPAGPYLRTGDLGCRLGDDLVVTGRRADLMIIRGRNIYPQDVEATVTEAHESVRPGGTAVFSIEVSGEEKAAVVSELERRSDSGVREDDRREKETLPEHEVEHPPEVRRVASRVREAVADIHRIEVEDVVFIKPGTVPKTSSGKIQRNKCCEKYLAEELDVIGRVSKAERSEGEIPEELPIPDFEELRDEQGEICAGPLEGYLEQLAAYVLEEPVERIAGTPLTRLGLDSLAAMEIQRHIEESFGVRLFPSALLGGADVGDVAEELLRGELVPEAAGADGSGSDATSEVFDEPPGRAKTETVTFSREEGAISSTEQEAIPMSFSEEDVPDPGETREEQSLREPIVENTSWNERGMWLYQQANPESWAPNLYFVGRLPEEVTYEDVEQSAKYLLRRHPNLRVRYSTRDGEPIRRYTANVDPEVRRHDARDWPEEKLREAFERERERPFDLEKGPVIRFQFYERSGRPILGLTVHHIVADFWSLEQLIWELGDELRGVPRGPGPDAEYPEYIRWQEEMLESDRGEWLREYWREELSGSIPRLELPGSSSGGGRTGYGETYRHPLDFELFEKVDGLAADLETTRYTVLLAAYQLLLYRWTGQSKFFVGAVAAGRTRSFFEQTVGMFVNPLPLCTRLSPPTTFEEHLKTTKRSLLRAMDAQEYPLQAMLQEFDVPRHSAGNPIVQTLFTSERPRRNETHLGGMETVAIGQAGTTFDLSVQVLQGRGTGEMRFQYDGGRFRESMIRTMAERYSGIIERLTDSTEGVVGTTPLVERDERSRLVEDWSRGPNEERGTGPIHRRFERCVRAHPNRDAVRYRGERWTYAELNTRANRLARRLRERGLEVGERVGVAVRRSAQLAAGLLAVAKAGGTYVALEPGLPEDRLEYMRADAGVEFVVADEAGGEAFEGELEEGALVDLEEGLAGEGEEENLEVEVDAEQPLYILYTSGTTGRPKGVMVPHRALLNHVEWWERRHEFGSDERFVWQSPYSFDMSMAELFAPLTNGAAVVPIEPGLERDPGALAERMAEEEITRMRLVPTTLQLLVDEPEFEACDTLEKVYPGGEVLTGELRDEFVEMHPQAELYNLYGPTEACITATSGSRQTDGDRTSGKPPIGRPIDNVEVYVLEALLEPVPVTGEGELWLAGAGLSHGYVGEPGKTAESFRPSPYGEDRGGRMYRTGDVVVWREDGELEYRGRRDDQLQVRGIRVELGEIEEHLDEAPGVKRAAVRALDESESRAETLVGYVVAERAEEIEVSELRDHLGAYLQESVVPTQYVELEEMPRTSSGKVDRSGLPAPDEQLRDEQRVEPRTETEQKIADLWRKHLEIDGALGVREDFFELGGHSLRAVQLRSDLEEEFGVEFPVHELLERTTIEELAVFATERETRGVPESEIEDILVEIEE